MRLMFMGTPQFAVPTLAALAGSSHEIFLVVSRPDRPAGRGHQVVAPAVKQEAIKRGIPVLQPQKIKDPAFLAHLRDLKTDLAVVVAFGRILPPEMLKIPKRGCINLHASLLPKYRGAAPIQWALINGERETGVTTMYIDEGMDTGPILLQERTQIDPSETAGQLAERLSVLGARLMLKTLDGIERGEISAKPQDSSLATAAPLLKKEDGKIRWDLEAVQIQNLIRGTDPWPGAYTFYRQQQWRIIRTRVIDHGSVAGPPGRILKVEKQQALVATGRGTLAILEVQPASGRRMKFQEFLAGHPVEAGVVLQGG